MVIRVKQCLIVPQSLLAWSALRPYLAFQNLIADNSKIFLQLESASQSKMRAKRSKQYRKLMQQYGLFGFREPYQVIVDADIVRDAERFKMNLVHNLERTLHGKVKPMITQCSMRHLYTAQPKNEALVEQAKTYERRRCNHQNLEKPLSTLDCLKDVVTKGENGMNKHRLIVASQDEKVRAHMRGIPGVPLVYINRSVMIMEPMADATEDLKAREERQKFRSGLKMRPTSGKRKREDEAQNTANGDEVPTFAQGSDPLPAITNNAEPEKKKKRKGLKGPNPLSVKKPKKRMPLAPQPNNLLKDNTDENFSSGKRRRKRKPSSRQEPAEPAVSDG